MNMQEGRGTIANTQPDVEGVVVGGGASTGACGAVWRSAGRRGESGFAGGISHGPPEVSL